MTLAFCDLSAAFTVGLASGFPDDFIVFLSDDAEDDFGTTTTFLVTTLDFGFDLTDFAVGDFFGPVLGRAGLTRALGTDLTFCFGLANLATPFFGELTILRLRKTA